MKRIYIALVGVVTLGVVTAGTVVANAANTQPVRPAWIDASGEINYKKMPDNVQIPYTCWNGKKTTLSGKVVRDKALKHAMPGSPEHTQSMEKSKELAKIPGVVTIDEQGGETVTIDDNNTATVAVMKKYELKETPECR